MVEKRLLVLSLSGLFRALSEGLVQEKDLTRALFYPSAAMEVLEDRTPARIIMEGEPITEEMQKAWEVAVRLLKNALRDKRAAIRHSWQQNSYEHLNVLLSHQGLPNVPTDLQSWYAEVAVSRWMKEQANYPCIPLTSKDTYSQLRRK